MTDSRTAPIAPTTAAPASPRHLRRGGTSLVLDLMADRFPVVRH